MASNSKVKTVKNNPNLKSANQEIELTYEQIQEYAKCMDDPIYFIKKYVYITHPVQGQIKFDLYDYQEELVKNYQNERNNIVLSARQTGKTETSSAYMLWFLLFQKKKTVLVVSKDLESAKEIVKKVKDGYELLPLWLKPGIDPDNWNKEAIEFDNGSRLVARTTSDGSGRGLAISLLYCDELAFVRPHIQDQFWDGVYPTLSTGGSCIITSTPNGDTNLFAKLWRSAELSTKLKATETPGTEDLMPFHATRIYWDQPPGRDEAFKKEKIAVLGERKWLQEYECEFISSDNSLFDTRVIQVEQRRVENMKPAFVINGEQEFYKPISQGMTYIVGVDPATGTGEDYSVIEVFEFPSLIQVMEYRANTVSEHVLYSYLKKVLGFLEQYAEEIYFSVENNGVGRAMCALYMQDERPPQFSHFMCERGKNKLGYTTTNATKREAAIRFKNFFERREMTILSPILFKEMKSYIRKGDGFEAQTGATDDCISAVFIIMRMLDDIAMYNPRAYDKLYKFGEQSRGDEWYTNDDFIPGGML
jgi:hypothetical protein